MKKLIPLIATCLLYVCIIFQFSFLDSFNFVRRILERIGLKYQTERVVRGPQVGQTDPMPPPPYPPPPPPPD